MNGNVNESIKDQIQNLARDLLNLEILTIVKPNITGQKMPEPKTALTEICNKYSIKLEQLNMDVTIDEKVVWGGRETFEKIIELTNAKISELKKQIKGLEESGRELAPDQMAHFWMLYRIKTMSSAIIGLYKGGQEIEPTTDNLVLIRKEWELGIEEIAMKTVIQLDGDVITRVQESYATADHATVHELHNVGVKTSLAFWKTLVDIVESFVSGIVRMMTPKK